MRLTTSPTTVPTTSTATFIVVPGTTPKIHLETDPSANLQGSEWSYDFGPDQTSLELVFILDSTTPLDGCVAELDDEGNWLQASAVALKPTELGFRHVWSCPLWTVKPRIQVHFYPRTPTEPIQGFRPDQPKPLWPPNEANPTMKLKPIRTSPAGGKTGPQTGDI